MKKFLLVILSLVMLMAVGCAKTETTPVVESKTIVEDALENPQATGLSTSAHFRQMPNLPRQTMSSDRCLILQ